MRRLLTLLAIIITTTLPASAQMSGDEALIRIMLATQVTEWNRGNIDGYMSGYWESDSMVFIGKSGPTYGYKATLDRYRKVYPDTAHMGKLTSTVLRVQVLSPEWAYATGKWELQRMAGNLSGHYTLLLRRMAGVWVIVEDHSS